MKANWEVVAHTLTPAFRGQVISEFEAILVYSVSSRTVRAAWCNHVWKNKEMKAMTPSM